MRPLLRLLLTPGMAATMRGCASSVSGSSTGSYGTWSRFAAPLVQHLPRPAQHSGPRVTGAAGVVAAAAAKAKPAPSRSRGVATTTSEQAYDAEQIQVLEGLDPVRKRPGMYIGSTCSKGLHHLVWEVLDNAVDEVQAGHADRVDLEVDLTTGWATVTDNGRGIPTGVHPVTGKSALETVLTVLHAGGKFGGEDSGYRVSGGLHGVGISVVNALSQELEVEVVRGGLRHRQRYARGAPVSELTSEPLTSGGDDHVAGAAGKGTRVAFRYDSHVFAKGVALEPDTLRARLRELAFLNPSARLRLRLLRGGVPLPPARHTFQLPAHAGEEATGAAPAPASNGRGKRGAAGAAKGAGGPEGQVAEDGWQTFQYAGGLAEYVAWLNRDKHPLHAPILATRATPACEISFALQWVSDAFSDTLVGFANSVKTVDGGAHMDGLRAALTRALNAAARRSGALKEGEPTLSGEQLREGLGGVISVRLAAPEFEGQTKTRLGNPEVRRAVEGAVAAAVGEWADANPAAFGAVFAKGLQAARAADAARRARELVRRKSVLTRSTLPGKLADCSASAPPGGSEIFIVEGDSAGGSAKQARDRTFQAVLPLRGKILNVERADDAALYKNTEIAALIVALGLGAGKDRDLTTDLSQLRYDRIVLLTDADVDGAHIRTLLLTFLFRYRRGLFEGGRVYAAVPPLYRVEGSGIGAAAAASTSATAAAGGGGGGEQQQPPPSQRRGKGGGGAGGAGNVAWAFDDAHLQRVVAGRAPGSYTVQRFKGLGEMMPQQLWDTTLNPQTRLLRKLTVDDAAEASHVFALLMGDKVAPRRQLIEQEGSRLALADLDI